MKETDRDERRDFTVEYQKAPKDLQSSPFDLIPSRDWITVDSLKIVLEIFNDQTGISLVDDYSQTIPLTVVPWLGTITHTFKFTATELDGKFIRARMFADGQENSKTILTHKKPFKNVVVFDTGLVATSAQSS